MVLGVRGVAIAVLGGVLMFSLVNQSDTQAATPSGGASERATARARAVPLDNPRGLRPGLAPVRTSAERRTAVRLIGRLRVGRMGPVAGYTRSRFGENWTDRARGVPYARNGCRTRDDLLARDGERVRYRKGSRCVVVSMRLRDPYTGRTIRWTDARPGDVQVDHVVPLSYGWRMGASRWPLAKRVRFANDPLNLMPVNGAVNQVKGGSGPASWLPPSRRIRCAYVVRFAQVAVKYGLRVTGADKATMLARCR